MGPEATSPELREGMSRGATGGPVASEGASCPHSQGVTLRPAHASWPTLPLANDLWDSKESWKNTRPHLTLEGPGLPQPNAFCCPFSGKRVCRVFPLREVRPLDSGALTVTAERRRGAGGHTARALAAACSANAARERRAPTTQPDAGPDRRPGRSRARKNFCVRGMIFIWGHTAEV